MTSYSFSTLTMIIGLALALWAESIMGIWVGFTVGVAFFLLMLRVAKYVVKSPEETDDDQ